jgi:large subunit ribosomal protein L24e
MVVKTQVSTWSAEQIFPGHGRVRIAKNGALARFRTKKEEKFFLDKTKPMLIHWTQAWRKANKKGAADLGKKSKNRQKARFTKAIVGMSLDDIKKRKAAATAARPAEAAKAAATKKADKKKGGAKQTHQAGGKQKQQGGRANMASKPTLAKKGGH